MLSWFWAPCVLTCTRMNSILKLKNASKFKKCFAWFWSAMLFSLFWKSFFSLYYKPDSDISPPFYKPCFKTPCEIVSTQGLKSGSLRLPTRSPWSWGIEITLNLKNFSISEGIPTWRLFSFLCESLLLQLLCRYCGKISHPWGAVLLRFWATPGVSPWVSVSNNDTDVISLEAITPLTWTAFATSPWKNWRCVWKKILGRKWRRWGTGFSRKFQAGAKLLLRGSFGTWALAPATVIEVLPFGRWCLRQLQGGRAGTATSTEALTIKEKKLRYNL